MKRTLRPAIPSVDPLSHNPPKHLAQREAHVALSIPNSIRVACDLPPEDPKRWFDKTLSDGKGKPLIPLDGNEVMYLIGYQEIHYAIEEGMQRAIKERGRRNRFIYLLGLVMETSVSMRTPIMNLLSSAYRAGVQVRVMLWKNNREIAQAFMQDGFMVGAGTIVAAFTNELKNQPEVRGINEHGSAIHDGRCLHFGSHHQKILVVHDGLELVAFCGSMDIGSSAHEVHCRIKGPAAYTLLTLFHERWKDHPNHVALEVKEEAWHKGNWDGAIPRPEPLEPTFPRQYVQIARTYGNGDIPFDLSDPVSAYGDPREYLTSKPYSFAPNGEQSAKKMILHAISQARQFIYIEDQYLVSMEVSKALESALVRGIKHLTILVTEKADMPQTGNHRIRFLAALRKTGGDKVGVFYRKDDYVHSKVYIMDDELAILGSANCNRRSLTYDSEVMAAICDQQVTQVYDYGYNFAHRLRIALWAEHLNMDTDEGRAELADGVASVVHWAKPPSDARIAPYQEMSYEDHTAEDVAALVETADPERISLAVPSKVLSWENVIDPDGS
jgi:phosphatidylserine/phosphatidylglycerophosphate/cardiolipin synthase-like enzyme